MIPVTVLVNKSMIIFIVTYLPLVWDDQINTMMLTSLKNTQHLIVVMNVIIQKNGKHHQDKLHKNSVPDQGIQIVLFAH